MSKVKYRGLVLIISPSGAGKTTIKKLIEAVDGLDLSVSVTTGLKKR